jgi:hypothetical protein
MGLLSFPRDAGEKLLQAGPARENAEAQVPDSPINLYERQHAMERALIDYMTDLNLPVAGLTLAYDAATATVTLSGSAPDQATREKIILCCGNVDGVAEVADRISISGTSAPASQWYTVGGGDSLATIAEKVYGDAGKAAALLQANQPMLTDADKTYPGQVLRIPKIP